MSVRTFQVTRPKIFIGSSSEAKAVAEALASLLEGTFECKPWWDAFPLSTLTLESLESACNDHSFALFVGSPDDVRVMRGKEERIVRDNVLCEFFLFIGRNGRDSTFLAVDIDEWPSLPSDLSSLTLGTYSRREFERVGASALFELVNQVTDRIWVIHKAKTQAARDAQRRAETSTFAHDAIEIFEVANLVRNMLDVVQHDTLEALTDEKQFAEIKDKAATQISKMCKKKREAASRVGVDEEYLAFQQALTATVRRLPFPTELVSGFLDAQSMFEGSIIGSVITIAGDVAEKRYPDALARALGIKDRLTMEECAREVFQIIENRLQSLRTNYSTWWQQNSKRVNTSLTALQTALMNAQTANALALVQGSVE